MWGNRLGWSISAVLMVLMLAALFALHRGGALSPPTALSADPANLAPLGLPLVPRSLSGIMSNAAGDAGPFYRQAIEAWQAERQAYERLLRHGRRLQPEEVGQLAVLDPLLKGAPCQRMDLFASNPARVVHYQPKADIDAIEGAGRVAILAGLALRSTDAERARKCYEAAFSLGMKLFNERLVYEELVAGMGLMGESAQAMLLLERANGSQQGSDILANFVQSYLDYDRDHVKPIISAIKAIDLNKVERHAGDVFVFATRAQERLWRVEAVFQLGRLRFSAARGADQRGAMRLLRKLADADSDPVVRAAAAMARDLTVEEYRGQGRM